VRVIDWVTLRVMGLSMARTMVVEGAVDDPVMLPVCRTFLDCAPSSSAAPRPTALWRIHEGWNGPLARYLHPLGYLPPRSADNGPEER